MADSTFWIAALTGGTAVVASWVTSRGNTRAAQIQADTAARAQQTERLRDSRRTAYLELIEQIHIMGDFYWEISAAQRNGDFRTRPALLDETLERERDHYGKLRHRARVVELEGPAAAGEAARKLQKSTGRFHRSLVAMAADDPEAIRRFNDAYSPFWATLGDFVDVAKTSLQEP
ncbi:hypothetical protein SSOG_02399 [Streptomyces himastatinicus ATCC 53653]|uniref:Uncharacterized protein n=1 Tax=Streptomyces himastatinicus ATCC 53653 TaxID=457427 RepID=D9W8H8_9ACTN|nr:hypothetical protein [Streptomyces himastatinicus]EFL22685.1 hypothetical protein SSOG_02399 [Streptomyces himastatinicus ATCC 53653]